MSDIHDLFDDHLRTMEDRERMKLETWLKTVPAEAVRELTGINAHGWRRDRMIAYILATPEAREMALESMRRTVRS